jgi:N-sulfoglucosamine sulfohydrolase
MRPILTAVAFAFVATSGRAAERPHVVIFLADDLSRSDCAGFGGTDVPMPNLTALAKDGKTFTQAYVASPSCAPSRAALLTGLDPMRNGAMLNHARPHAALKKWPAYFREIGYECVAIGKVAHYAQVSEYGFDHVSHFTYHADECVNEAVKWLASRESKRPLCLFVGTNWPHVPWPEQSPIVPRVVPPKLVDTPETRTARGRYLAAVANCDRDLGLVRAAAKKHLGENVLFAFTSDHGSQFPFGKWNGYDEGVRTPLVVAWPGRVTAGSTTDAMVSWIDLLPTTLAACGGTPPDALSGKSFLDVLTGKSDTHRDKVFITHSGDGRMNRYPLRAVRTPGWKYIRNLDPDAEHHTHVNKGNAGADGRNYWDSWVAKAKSDPAAAAVIKRYHFRPAEELYDVTADPWEAKNLAADPAHAARKADLAKALDAWMAANGDEGLKTERALPDPQPKKKKD